MSGKRNAIKYNSVGIFLTDSPAAKPGADVLYFFNRVQSASVSVDVGRQDIQHIGSEDFLDRKIVSELSTKLSLEYLLTDGYEENLLGLNILSKGQEMPSSTLNPTENSEKNYKANQGKSAYYDLKEDKTILMAVGAEPFDLTGYENRNNHYSGVDVIGIGNCYITDYSISAGVGEFPKASVSYAASNLRHSCNGSGYGGHYWLDNVNEVAVLLTQLNAFIELQNGQNIGLGSSEQKFYKAGVQNPSLDLANKGADLTGPKIERHGGEIALGTGIEFNPKMYKSPVAAIAPGGINVNLRNLNVGGPILSGKNEGTCIEGSANIQSFNINLPFAREDLYGFESMHVYGRKMKYPQIGSISFSLLASAFNSGDFRKIFCQDEDYKIEISLNNHCDYFCSASSEHESYIKYIINNARFESYSFSESIGSIATVDCSFSFGVSPNNGFFMSGSFEDYYLAMEQQSILQLGDDSLVVDQ